MSFESRLQYKAEEAFNQARRRAFLQRALDFLRRQQSSGLLSFDTVRDKLKISGQHYAGVQTIPVDKIVGSVGRYQEFNRAFLPTQEHIRERWKRVYAAAHMQGFPPIDVYQVGDVYFVRDGHHRVSVLKELGAPLVEAYVTEFDSPVPLAADVADSDLDLKEEYATFLLETHLGTLRPEQRLEFTLPGQYGRILEHIAVHRYFLGLNESRDVPYAEAVGHWYDEVYCPLVDIIRESDILAEFPGRTETDLYLWLIEHRHYLSEDYGYEVPYEEAAADFTRAYSRGAGKRQLLAEVKRAQAAHQAGERAQGSDEQDTET